MAEKSGEKTNVRRGRATRRRRTGTQARAFNSQLWFMVALQTDTRRTKTFTDYKVAAQKKDDLISALTSSMTMSASFSLAALTPCRRHARAAGLQGRGCRRVRCATGGEGESAVRVPIIPCFIT